MKNIFVTLCFICLACCAFSQEYSTEDGHLLLISKAPLLDFEGNNHMTYCMVTSNGEVSWSIQMDAFRFENADIENRFSEDLLETNLYPMAEFTGAIAEGSVIWGQEGIYDIMLLGDINLHGQSKIMEYPALIQILDSEAILTIRFMIDLVDFNITIPADMEDKVADSFEFNLSAMLK